MRLLGKCVPIGACYDAACRRGEPLAAHVQLRAESGSARLSTRAPLIRIPHGRRLNQIQEIRIAISQATFQALASTLPGNADSSAS